MAQTGDLVLQTAVFFLLTAASLTSAQMARCPFPYIYHFGDGFSDIGNSVLIPPWGPNLPAAKFPYGITYPGHPTGRWSDGLIDFDFAAFDTSHPDLVPFLAGNYYLSSSVIFSVARSPVLDREFFEDRGVVIPPHATSLKEQARWFREYLREVAPTPQQIEERLASSIIFFGDIEASDIGYGLSQGKSIEEVRTYVPAITDSHYSIAKQVVLMGAEQIVISDSAYLGCFPYILASLSHIPGYQLDDSGCVKEVNDLIDWKNNQLKAAVANLSKEFPEKVIIYSPFSKGFKAYLEKYVVPNGPVPLRACCGGGGGRYNYNAQMECGSRGARACRNPNQHLFWDGYYFTQEAYNIMEKMMIPATFPIFNCTILDRAAAGIIRLPRPGVPVA